MIIFDLTCDSGHRFEGWFTSSSAFTEQHGEGLVSCPQCGSLMVEKAPMAPAVGKKSNQRSEIRPHRKSSETTAVTNGTVPPEVAEALMRLARVQAKALERSKWVGEKFAETSRAIHYGEREAESIHGQATVEEAQELIDEGISVAPLPFPVNPPEDLN